jgi:hypothetical protein
MNYTACENNGRDLISGTISEFRKGLWNTAINVSRNSSSSGRNVTQGPHNMKQEYHPLEYDIKKEGIKRRNETEADSLVCNIYRAGLVS